ncbi:MAG: acyl-CoA dehydrogenase [Acidimicrobiales bacterium]|nr:acyl-CoA dehydrogenase [Acidimicrobiales bacterium]
MPEYTPPLEDLAFVLRHVVDLDALAALEPYKHADADTSIGLLEEAGRFMAEVVAPTNQVGDQQGSQRQPDGTVVTPDGFREAYAQYVDAGWGAVPFDPEYGGGGFPWLVAVALQELLSSANMAFSMAPLLTQGAIDMLSHHGSLEQKQAYLPKMITGEWTGTMNLTEPDAGSDVGALRTRAEPVGDGTYKISGTKIFISFGEHDLTDNIVHLVLARTPGAPPGTKGISCFIVPKVLANGDRNAVRCASIEHKMGIKASPTCVLEYDGAIGELIGDENAGMRYMFTMMNNARVSVGVEGLSLAERAYQQAVEFARERGQGRAPGAPAGVSSPIVEHPDVRRMLLTMRATTEAMRALAYVNAEAIDLARHHPDDEVRARAQERADLLTPVTKGWSTDMGVEVTSLAIQVHGGMGYVEETGVAQHFRDARITPIYEGTNGIQAMDLVGRKLPIRMGGAVADLLGEMAGIESELTGDLAALRAPLADAVAALREATDWLLANGLEQPVDALAGATPYLRMFGIVTGGWLLARSAVAARELLASGEGDLAFLADKVVTARFYAEQLLPAARGLLPAVTAGAGDLFAIAADRL